MTTVSGQRVLRQHGRGERLELRRQRHGAGAGAGTGTARTRLAARRAPRLATIDSLDKLEVVSGFAEADATKIAVGQPATITFPALPDIEVAGKVTAVSSTSTVVSNVVTYNETIALSTRPPTVKEGMTADVSVVDQTASNVLELPSSAITTTGTVSTVELAPERQDDGHADHDRASSATLDTRS